MAKVYINLNKEAKNEKIPEKFYHKYRKVFPLIDLSFNI